MFQVLSSTLTTTNQTFLTNQKRIVSRIFGTVALTTHPGFYLFIVNNRKTKSTRARYDVCLKLTRRSFKWHHSVTLIVNRFHIFIWCFHRWRWANKCWFSKWIVERDLFWAKAITSALLQTNMTQEWVTFYYLQCRINIFTKSISGVEL